VSASRKDVKLWSLDQLCNAPVGDSKEHAVPQPHGVNDLSTVLYTSGTTGDPKGVMLTAANQLASAAGCLLLDSTFDGSNFETSTYFKDAVYISYLPLAHSFELNMQILILSCASSIGFYQGDVRKLVTHDMPALQPTIMAGVPRVFNRIYDKVMQGLENKGAVARAIFRAGFSANQRAMSRGGRAKVWDSLLFGKLQAVLGGKVKIFLTGAAPMSGELQNFLKVGLPAPRP